MDSPRPVRRFSRWQTRKRTFVLDGTAFSDTTSNQATDKGIIKYGDQIVEKGKLLTEEKENDESPAQSECTSSASREKSYEKMPSPLLDRRKRIQTFLREENEKNVDVPINEKQIDNSIQERTAFDVSNHESRRPTSFNQSEGDLNESRSLRKRNLIKKPPSASYPVQFLSASQRRPASLKRRRSLFNSAIGSGLDESKELSNGSQGVGLVSNKSDQKTSPKPQNSNQIIEIRNEVVAGTKNVFPVGVDTMDDGETKKSDVETTPIKGQNVSKTAASNNGSFIPVCDRQLTDYDLDISHLHGKAKKPTKETDILQANSEQIGNIERDIGDNVFPLTQPENDAMKNRPLRRTNSPIDHLALNEEKSMWAKNVSDTCTSGKSESNSLTQPEDGNVTRIDDEGSEAKSVLKQSQSSENKNGHSVERNKSSVSHTKLNNTLTAASKSENVLDEARSHTEDVGPRKSGCVSRTKEYRQRKAQGKTEKDTGRSFRTTTEICDNATASLQLEVDNETPCKGQPNESRNLRQRNSLRKPPSSLYPEEFMSSSLKRLLPSSKSRGSPLNASIQQTSGSRDNTKLRPKRKSPLDTEKNSKKGRKSISVTNDELFNHEKSKGLSKISQNDTESETVLTGLHSVGEIEIEIDKSMDPPPSTSSRNLSNGIMKKSKAFTGERCQAIIKHSEVNNRLKTSAPNVKSKLPTHGVTEKNLQGRCETEKETSHSEQKISTKSPVQLSNGKSMYSNDNASTTKELSSEKRGLRNRDSIRKPPPASYPLEFLSSCQIEALSSLLSKKRVHNKHQDSLKPEGSRKGTKKKYSLPRKKSSKKELGSRHIPMISDRTTDSTFQVSLSFEMVDSLKNDTTNSIANPNKTDKGNHHSDSVMENSNNTDVQNSQPLNDTVRGIHKMRRKRILFSEFETNPAHPSMQPTISSQSLHNASTVRNEKVVTKTAVRKNSKNKKKQNQDNANKPGHEVMNTADGGDNQNSKIRGQTGSKPKDVISDWMSSYRRFIRKLASN